MDLNSISQLAGEQGPVFWAAAAAVSLGLTLLVVALVQTLVRMVSARAHVKTLNVDAAAPEAPPVSTPEPTPTTPEFVQTAYAAGDSAPTNQRPEEDSSLAILLRRLQSAGDRLEEIAGDLETAALMDDRSSLKSEPRAVEYVFRASGS